MHERFPKLSELMDKADAVVLAFMGFPKERWRELCRTNPLERANKEIKRRAQVIGFLPNEAAIMRLVGARAIK